MLKSKASLVFLTTVFSFTTGFVHAEDTEIYFSADIAVNESERPNLLFILDSSGSMASSAGSSGQSRIDALKDAMNDILNDVEGVNVGLMRFHTFDGGPVLFPITYIDDAANTVPSEEDDSKQSYTYSISSGDDDAIEVVSTNDGSTSATDLPSGVAVGDIDNSVTSAYLVNSPDVPAVTVTTGGSSGTYQQTISSQNNDAYEYYGSMNRSSGNLWFYNAGNLHNGMRFTNLNIPVNAKIDSANLRLRTNANYGSTRNADIYAIDADDVPGQFSGSNNELSSATLTSASVNWSVSTSSSNKNVTSPDISSIIQEIVSNGCATVGDGSTAGCTWSTNNNIVLITKNASGTKRFYSRDGTNSSSRRPRLTIDWSVPGTSSTTTAQEGVNYITGLRFQGVNIPQGATVTSAKLKVSSSQNNQNDTTSWTISAENTSDSEEFELSSGNLSGRTKTTSVPWTLPASNNWENDGGGNVTTEESPELSTIVQTIVNDANWCGGNAITFFIQGTDYSDGREIYHKESGSGYEPQLFVEYDKASGTGGCIAASNSDEVASSTHDAEENTGSGSMTRFSTDLDLESGTDVGIFFEEVNVPRGVTVTEAYIRFTSDEVDTGNSTMTISVEDTDDSTTYSSSTNDITSRNYLSSTVIWTPEDWDSNNSSYFTSDIKTLVQSILNRPGWEIGNGMGFKISTSGNDRRAKSYDHGDGISDSPRLIINYEASATSSVKTVRERLIEIVDDLPAADATPITETLFEAANYWSGAEVQLGKKRYHSSGNQSYASDNRISHPGSYCTTDETTGVVDCGNANTASYPNFGINTPSGCFESNLNDSDCRDRRIEGSNVKYISPFKSDSQCAANYQILITDGEANNLSSTYKTDIRNDYLSGATCDTTRPDGTSVASSESCALDLVEHMATNDLSSTIDDEQTVTTYTVGFDTESLVNATNFLTNMAEVGEGEFKEADDAASLAAVFQEIFADVRDEPTSFASPALSTNAFNTLFSRDEVFFGLFTPDTRRSWKGNVKKFSLCTSTPAQDSNAPANCDFVGRILDSNGNQAIGTDNRFDANALSFWTNVNDLSDGLTGDGVETLEGGSGKTADDYTQRIIYTDTTASGTAPSTPTALNTNAYTLTSSTWNSSDMANVRNNVCTTPSTANGSVCSDVMQWMLGKVIDNDATDVDTDSRWTINDILHASPTIITYGGADTDSDGQIDEFYDKAIFSSNGGALHFINASNDANTGGHEEWAFIPQEVLTNQEAVYTNAQGDQLHNFDLTPIVRRCDGDRDGSIEPTADDGCDANQDGVGDGDFVHVIAGMRRGGRNYYALDVSGTSALTSDEDNSIEPKFLWRIEGGTTAGFEDLAYTWSVPILTTIAISDNSGGISDKEVLIFGGGYDLNLDDGAFGANGQVSPSDSSNDNIGNVVYIVDPYDGSLILSVGGSNTTALIKDPNMHHSIPSQISTLDSDGDGDTDRLYFGDTGGQVWRIDLANDINPDSASAPQGSTVLGRLASISTAGGTPAADQRRFFEKASVAQVLDSEFSSNSTYDYIVLGTGNRDNPLDVNTEDYLFAFRDYQTSAMTAAAGTNLAQNYPSKSSGTGPIVVSDMVDATNSILEDLDANTVQNSSGWYINFSTIATDAAERDGEKILSPVTTLFGNVFFTTYSPNKVTTTTSSNSSGDTCIAEIGGGSLYGFGLIDTQGYFADGVSGREQGTTLGGIASAVIPIFTKDGVYGLVGTEGGALQFDEDGNATEFQIGQQAFDRTYWYEY